MEIKMKRNVFFLCFVLTLVVISCPADNDPGDNNNQQPETVTTPTASPQPGIYASAQTVTLSSATTGAAIYYTTDGSDPASSSTLYIDPINVSATTTIKGIAMKEGMSNSAIMTAVYTINSSVTYTVTVTANPATGGTVTCSPYQTNYPAGTQIAVTAQAHSGYNFIDWTGAPLDAVESDNTITFNINSNVNLTANFQTSGATPIVRERLSVDYASTGTRRHNRQRYDLRLPDTGEGPFPLLMYIHGGGFTGGDWQLSQNNNGLVLAARSRGYAVASIGYLLMTNNQRAFPELVEDVLAAVRHLRANAVEYRLDPDRFAVSGFSAGAYLSSIICALSGAQDHGYDVTSLGNAGVSSDVQAAASSAALTDFSLLETHESINGGGFLDHNASPEGALLGGHLQNDKDNEPMKTYLRMQNPLTHISAVTPPIYMLHGASDTLVPWQQSEIMVNKINEFVPNKAVFNKVTGRNHEDFPAAASQITIAILDFLDGKLGIQR
jgi:acetyl esterase/lipase